MAVQVKVEPGDRVKLISHQQSHPWTERLVDEEGWVVEISEAGKAIAVSFSMLEGVLWFSPKRLELVERKAA